MDKAFYLQHLVKEAKTFVETIRAGELPPSVPSCPAWNVTDLLLHLGTVHRFVTEVVANKHQTAVPFDYNNFAYIKLPPNYMMWLKQAPADQPIPTALVEWFSDGISILGGTLEAVEPDEPVWHWTGVNLADSWHRMMALETATHRWDMQGAYQTSQPIEADLARENIDFIFERAMPIRRRHPRAVTANGEIYYFRQADGTGEWLVQFDPSEASVSHTQGAADVSISGTASDLSLFLWHRIPASNLTVSGDESLISRYFELMPTF